MFLGEHFFPVISRKSPCLETKGVKNPCRTLSITFLVKPTSLAFKSSSSANIKGVEFSPLELSSEGILFLNTEWHGRNWCMDASKEDGFSLGRLVNDETKDPTCKMRTVEVSGKPHLCLFAVRDILPGEEITYDYGNSDWPWRDKKWFQSRRINTSRATQVTFSIACAAFKILTWAAFIILTCAAFIIILALACGAFKILTWAAFIILTCAAFIIILALACGAFKILTWAAFIIILALACAAFIILTWAAFFIITCAAFFIITCAAFFILALAYALMGDILFKATKKKTVFRKFCQ
ncbi:N-lysine methyltransferase KMT5A [Pimephales promelas]|nr:N-lysine methyltransferase KMT5A [Pimephales promelas]